jgi:hypothetical protein
MVIVKGMRSLVRTFLVQQSTTAEEGSRMLSLADELELMNDFESDEGEEDVEMEVEVGVKKEEDDDEEEVDSSLLSRGIKQVELLDANSVERMSLSAVTSVDKVAKLYNSKLLKEVLIVSFNLFCFYPSH